MVRKVITISVKVEVYSNVEIDLGYVVQEMDYDFTSNTDDVYFGDMEIIDFEVNS